MELKMYALSDQAVECFNRPFCARSNGEAIRSLADELNRGDNPMALHPEDYVLYFIGVFDDDTGVITATETPMVLQRCADLIIKEEE